MKNMKLILPVLGLVCLLCAGGLLASCAEPVPLYGTWADNKGDTFSFFNDGNFNAKIYEGSAARNYEGTYSVLLNALTLNCAKPVDLRVVTEWDIRGNMLYLEWTNEEGTPLFLTLYKVSN